MGASVMEGQAGGCQCDGRGVGASVMEGGWVPV